MLRKFFSPCQNFWRVFKRKYLAKIRYQFAILLIISIIIPILCMQLINFQLTSKMALKKNAEILDDNLILSKINADNVVFNYQQLLYQIFTDEIFLKNLENFDEQKENSTGYSYACYNISNSIITHLRLYPEVRAIGIMSRNNKIHTIVEPRQKNQHIINYFNKNVFSIFEGIEHQSTASLDLIKIGNTNYEKTDPIFYITQRIINHENMKYLGGIVLFISPNALDTAINNENSATYQFSNKLVITEDNSILCSKDNLSGINISMIPKYKDFDFTNISERMEYKNQKALVSVVNLSNYDLRLVSIVDNNILLRDMLNLWSYSFILIGLVMCIALVLAIFSSNKVIQSVERMSSIMNMVNENNLNISVETKSNNEIRAIETSFNHMVKRINRLLKENKEQYEHILKITKESHLAELRSLELQINPHFLFNTIDTINWMAIRKECYDVSVQLSNLAQILRHTVYEMNGVVPINKEIEWLKCYLDLQKNRFQKFNYDIFINADVHDLFIHKLLIQPFIENSIVHGFEDISHIGYISINFSILSNKYLMIKILDNGGGISPEKVKLINQLFRTGENGDFGVGLENIACRISNYYGNRCKVYARSNQIETCFTIYIPKDVLGG